MKDKYKPWPLLDLFKISLLSAGIPIVLAIFNRPFSLSKTLNLLWLYTGILLVIFIVFFARDRWCCSKKDDQIDSLEADATNYRKNHDTEIKKQHDQRITGQATGEYIGKHGMHQLNDKID